MYTAEDPLSDALVVVISFLGELFFQRGLRWSTDVSESWFSGLATPCTIAGLWRPVGTRPIVQFRHESYFLAPHNPVCMRMVSVSRRIVILSGVLVGVLATGSLIYIGDPVLIEMTLPSRLSATLALVGSPAKLSSIQPIETSHLR